MGVDLSAEILSITFFRKVSHSVGNGTIGTVSQGLKRVKNSEKNLRPMTRLDIDSLLAVLMAPWYFVKQSHKIPKETLSLSFFQFLSACLHVGLRVWVVSFSHGSESGLVFLYVSGAMVSKMCRVKKGGKFLSTDITATIQGVKHRDFTS